MLLQLAVSLKIEKMIGFQLTTTQDFKRHQLRNKFNFWSVHGIMNTSGLLQSKWMPKGLMFKIIFAWDTMCWMIPWTDQKLNLLLKFPFYIISLGRSPIYNKVRNGRRWFCILFPPFILWFDLRQNRIPQWIQPQRVCHHDIPGGVWADIEVSNVPLCIPLGSSDAPIPCFW